MKKNKTKRTRLPRGKLVSQDIGKTTALPNVIRSVSTDPELKPKKSGSKTLDK